MLFEAMHGKLVL